MSCKTNSAIRQRPCANRTIIDTDSYVGRVVALLGLCCALLRRAVVPGTRQLKSRYIPAANVAADSFLQDPVQVLASGQSEVANNRPGHARPWFANGSGKIEYFLPLACIRNWKKESDGPSRTIHSESLISIVCGRCDGSSLVDFFCQSSVVAACHRAATIRVWCSRFIKSG